MTDIQDPGATPEALGIKQIGVIGAGQMGSGIAHVAATTGINSCAPAPPARRKRPPAGGRGYCVYGSVATAFRRRLASCTPAVLLGMCPQVVGKADMYPTLCVEIWVDAGHRHGVP